MVQLNDLDLCVEPCISHTDNNGGESIRQLRISSQTMLVADSTEKRKWLSNYLRSISTCCINFGTLERNTNLEERKCVV